MKGRWSFISTASNMLVLMVNPASTKTRNVLMFNRYPFLLQRESIRPQDRTIARKWSMDTQDIVESWSRPPNHSPDTSLRNPALARSTATTSIRYQAMISATSV